MYVKRKLEFKINEAMVEYCSIVITGARQVGKSTLIQMIDNKEIHYITLDDLDALNLALNDPKYFLDFYNTPLCIDEIQKAPQLLNIIKIKIDEEQIKAIKENRKPQFLYFLTGSQQFSMMKNISESLAGRIAVFNLYGLSKNEIENVDNKLFVPDINLIKKSKIISSTTKDIFEKIFTGGMPDYVVNKKSRELFFSSYIDTYINRDIKEYLNVGKSTQFYSFMQYIAVRTACEVDYTDISRSIGVDSTTIKRWISILESSGIIYLLQPFSSNLSNRIIKRPKLYFMDTGLCTYLAKWPNSEVLEVGAMAGNIFETYVVSEIIKNYYNNGVNPKNYFYYYRDKDQYEIDLLYVDELSITPIEIKKAISPNNPDKNFKVLNKFKTNINTGIVICLTNQIVPLNKTCILCPVGVI